MTMLITATTWRRGLAPSDIVRALANLWNLGLLLAAAITLLRFLYWVFLKKLLRARRIANIRLNRLMRERGSERGDHP
jgi:hypothetical protein